jgi:NADH-quinone oxidoreductase subunit E
MQSNLEEQIEVIATRYPTRRSAIMPSLALALESEGPLRGNILKEVADVLDVPEIWVFEIASFYTMFHTEPVGKFHIKLCTNVSCLLTEAMQLLQHLETRLQISIGDTTPDGLFTLSTVECLGSCDTAPVLMVNRDYHENLNVERIDEILSQLTN